MNTKLKKTLMFWLSYGKFTTFVLLALVLMLMCKTAKAEGYIVAWTLELKYFEEQPAIVILPEGPVEIVGGFCKVSSVHMTPITEGEFRVMSCGPSREFDVTVRCNLDGTIDFLSAPEAAITYPTMNPRTLEMDFLLSALRCQVIILPDPPRAELI
jgi:hypothetical protein